MAKDRFKTRASWDTNFKYSGQVMSNYSAPKKEPLSTHQQRVLTEMIRNKEYINDWEVKFLRDILTRNFKLSERQKSKVRDIFVKIENKKND